VLRTHWIGSLPKSGDFTQNPAASGRRLNVVANNTQLVFAQAMQLIRVDTPFPHEISQDEEEHGVFEFVLGVDLFPTLGQMAFKFQALRVSSLQGWVTAT